MYLAQCEVEDTIYMVEDYGLIVARIDQSGFDHNTYLLASNLEESVAEFISLDKLLDFLEDQYEVDASEFRITETTTQE